MPVPWEALIPFGVFPCAHCALLRALSAFTFIGLVTVMFGATGTLLKTSKTLQNQGKVRRKRSRRR